MGVRDLRFENLLHWVKPTVYDAICRVPQATSVFFRPVPFAIMVYAAVHDDFNMIVDTITIHQVSDPEHSRKLYMSAKK